MHIDFVMCKKGDPFDLLKIQFAAKYFKKLKRDPSETLKKFEIFEKRKMRILKQSHSAEKLERGDIFGLLKLQFAAKHQNTWRGTLWRQKKIEKSSTVPKFKGEAL